MSAGYRSLLAFWMGGAAKPAGVTPPTPSNRPRRLMIRKHPDGPSNHPPAQTGATVYLMRKHGN